MNQPLDTNEDEEKKGENKREGFKMAFRRRLFQIYFELMRERNIDQIFAALMLAISFTQIFGLLYNTKVNFPFKDDLYTTICKICNIVRIYPLIEGAAGIYYWVLAYALIVFMVFYVLQLIFVDYSIKIDKFYFVFPVKLLRYQSSLIQWVLLQPTVEVFVGIFSCENGHHIVDTTLQCWTGMHIFYCILFSICLMIYIVIFIMISFFYNESRPYHTDAFARLDTNFETYLALYRILICIVGNFLYQAKLHWLIIAIHICGSINFCKMYLKYLPYYNNLTSVLFGSGWFAYFWISLNVLLTKALETVDYQGQSIVIIIGLLLIYPATYQIRDMKIQRKIFNKKHDKIKSEYELDIFIHKLYRLIIDQHVNEVDEMILLGVVHNHQSECLNNECPLNTSEELYLPLTESISDRRTLYSKDPILLYHLINSIYAEYAKSSNSTSVLHTTYAYFLFYQIGNIHTALLELNVAEKCDANFQQKFTIYRAKRFIETYLFNKFGKGREITGKSSHDLDVTIVITFESLYAKLNKEIEKSANDHIEFWSHLDSQMVDLNVLHKLGLNIITNTKRINEIWHQLTRINPHYPKALQIYGNYLIQIKNDNFEGDEFLNQANLMARPKSLDEHVNDFEMMFAEDTAIVVISGNKDSQAKIMKTNNGITKLFGYNTFEVLGHEVNILMPPIIGVKHSYFLEQFFKTGREKVINNDIDSFAMLRVGHIFSVTLIVKPVPSLKNDIQYIGLIKPINRDYDFIITDQYGRIDSISKGITSMLQLQASFFKENEIFIQVLCPQLCEVEKVKQSKEYKTKFDIWSGVKDLTFIIPKNFSNLSQKAGGRGTNANSSMMNISNNNMSAFADDEEHSQNLGRNKEASFVGLKSPDHLKKVCNMFRNNDFKGQPQKYLQTLKLNINYDNPEILRGPIKTDIINKTHGGGYLQMKVFKILNPKRAGTGDDSDSERDVQNNQGNKNIKQMIEEINRKILMNEMTSEDLIKRIMVMKITIAQIKKGNRHPSLKYKATNISTPNVYEKAEIQKMERDLRVLEQKIDELKQLEDEKLDMEDSKDDEGNPDFGGAKRTTLKQNKKKGEGGEFLLNDEGNLDYEKIKNQYPLRENVEISAMDISVPSIRPQQDMNQNDMSAFQDDSMMHEQSLMGANKQDLAGYSNAENVSANQRKVNANLFEEMDALEDLNVEGGPKRRFKDDDEKLDFLKDIRKGKKEHKKVKKDDHAEGKDGPQNQGEEQNEGEAMKDDATTEAEGEDGKFLEEDVGSVASSTKSLMKHLRMLRNALYENYSPPSIRNLKFQARFVFLALLIIAIVWYVYAKQVYGQLQDNIDNIHSSKDRMNSLTDIAADVRILNFMQQGRVNSTRGGHDYENFKRDDLNTSAKILQTSQNNLSETYLRDKFTKENNDYINPPYIQIIYKTPAELPNIYIIDTWSTLMNTAVHAYTVKDLALKDINMNNTSVFIILQNTFNNVLYAIENSTKAILNETFNLSQGVKKTLMILLIVASGSLLVSICFIFPVATKVDKDKDELLRHFMAIDRDDVKKQLDKCRTFFNTMHDKEHVTQQNMNDIDEEDIDKEDDEEEKDGTKDGQVDPNKQHKKGRQRSRKNKMHKKFSTNFLSLILKFLVVVSIMEGYFLLCYFQSGDFLKIANNLINESGSITLRQFSNNFLYQVMQEVLTTNGRAQVNNTDSLGFMFDYLNSTIQEQEQFLKTHSNNSQYHSAEFNTFFDNLIYQNVCDAVYKTGDAYYDSCGTFMGGILKKGLYSANVAYWDTMRSMATDFNNSLRDVKAINQILNSDRLVDNEIMKDVYFTESYKQLLIELDKSVLYRFDEKDNMDTIIFACYVAILFILYFVCWRKFIEMTRHSLWVTKSMLAIIPLEIIQKVNKIKEFLLASSKNTLSAFKD